MRVAVILLGALVALALAGCVTNAPQPVTCFLACGPELPPFASALQWPECRGLQACVEQGVKP